MGTSLAWRVAMPSKDDLQAEPLRRVLVATDFSKGAEFALMRALRLPLAAGSELRLVHVLRPDIPKKLRSSASKTAKQALEKLASSARKAMRARQLDVQVVPELSSGEAFVELIRCSRSLGSELIVLGRHGRRPIRDMFIGTTADRVIRKGDVPALVVNAEPESAYQRPIIATDLEDASVRIFELAVRVVGSAKEQIHVVHAFNVPFEGLATSPLTIPEKSEYRRFFKERALAKMAEFMSRYESAGFEWRTTIRAGDPRLIVPAEAARRRADLIALGTHGRSGVAHSLVGSVAEWVIASAPCDVLVARPVRFSFELP